MAENKNLDKEYYIGLDIGTNSCGWAVTDKSYNLVKAKGKRLWGVRLFDEAQKADERRVKRANRRRLDRRKLKLDWLREIFEDEISLVDKHFLQRLKYSNLYEEDKQKMNVNLKSKDSLFCDIIGDKKFTDKEFYQKYKTIYHLRQSVKNQPAEDIRFLYLALHGIVKRRGHFLFEGDFEESGLSLKDSVNSLIESLNEINAVECLNSYSELNPLDEVLENQLIDIVNENKLSVREKKKKLNELFGSKKGAGQSVVECLLDGKFKISAIFNVEIEKEKDTQSFADEKFDTEALPILEECLSEEEMLIIDKLKAAYGAVQLKKILGDSSYICDAKVKQFEKHQEQLKQFKQFIKKYYKEKYNEIFKAENDKIANYASYVNGGITNGRKIVVNGASNFDHCSKDMFYKYIKSVLVEPTIYLSEEDRAIFEKDRQQILSAIEAGNFLEKLRTKDNSVLPNKLYVKEVKAILKTNAQKYPFLNEVDSSCGLTASEKIVKILEFRVPYFVGPIGSCEHAENNFGWAQKEDVSLDLKPWTLDKIVNFDKAEDKFISDKINKCTYCKTCDVLPRHSLLYSRYIVLNELNNLKINGSYISTDVKQQIFNEVFKHKKSVTSKMIKDFYLENGLCSKEEYKEMQVSGIDKDFKSSLKSFILFRDLLSESFVNEHTVEIEKMIKYITVIEDKKRLENRLVREFGDLITKEQIAKIKGFNFAGWGRLSKQFLEDMQVVNFQTGEITCVINELWQTNQNLQEILNNTNYDIQNSLFAFMKKEGNTLIYQDIENSYCSPGVKRAVWQTIKIVNEIISLIGKKPEKVFVEVSRFHGVKGEKGRKLKRKDSLLALYNSKEFRDNVEEITFDINKVVNELNKEENDGLKLRSEKLYLYFLQLGRCMYSGEEIDINDLFNKNEYDIDHIIPQSIIKDDSINNKVLVKKIYNENKKEEYPIATAFPDWCHKQEKFWRTLYKMKLMSKSKLDRLIRKTPLTEDELGQFIARQLVETNQSAKCVVDLLSAYLDNQRSVVLSKAMFVSEFRKVFGVYKSRLVNDLHHAKDAYLNIVVGNILYHRFTDDPRHFYTKERNNKGLSKNVVKIFASKIHSHFNENEVVWDCEQDLDRIKKIACKNDCLLTRMNYANLNGAFYDETLYKKSGKASVALKGDEQNPLSDIKKYGGYNSVKNAYFMVIDSEDKKGNVMRTIEALPIMIYRKYRNDLDKNEKFLQYFISEYGLINPKIVIDRLNYQTTVKLGKGVYYLAGKTGASCILRSMNQWFLDNDQIRYVKGIEKMMDIKKNANLWSRLEEKDNKVILSKAKQQKGYDNKYFVKSEDVALSRDENVDLYDIIVSQLSKGVYQSTLMGYRVKPALEEFRGRFLDLSVLEQGEQLYKIMQYVSSANNVLDIKLLGGKESMGLVTISKNITNLDIKFIATSITGTMQKNIEMNR